MNQWSTHKIQSYKFMLVELPGVNKVNAMQPLKQENTFSPFTLEEAVNN